MNTMIERLLETIEKDLQEIESNSAIDKKIVRKECNLLKQRIASFKKINPKENSIKNLEQRIEKLLQRS